MDLHISIVIFFPSFSTPFLIIADISLAFLTAEEHQASVFTALLTTPSSHTWMVTVSTVCHVIHGSWIDFYLMCHFIFTSTEFHLPVTKFCERYTGDIAQDFSFTTPSNLVLSANFPNCLRIRSYMGRGESAWSKRDARMVQRSPHSPSVWTRSPQHSSPDGLGAVCPVLHWKGKKKKKYNCLKLSEIRKLTPVKTDLKGNVSFGPYICSEMREREEDTTKSSVFSTCWKGLATSSVVFQHYPGKATKHTHILREFFLRERPVLGTFRSKRDFCR